MDKPTKVQYAEMRDIDNFSRIDERPWLAGSPVGFGGATQPSAMPGLKFIHLPFNPKKPDSGIVAKFVASVSDETNQPVYIYCNTATRVAALWMIARVREDGWEIDAAREETKATAAKPDEAIAFATKYIESNES